MKRGRETLLRLGLILAAIAVPLIALSVSKGPPPITLDTTELDRWSPITEPGPSANFLAGGLTLLAGVGEGVPDWFDVKDQDQLAEAKGLLERNRLQESLGVLLQLSGRLEERGKTLNDFLPVVMPDLASWMIANYFAPVLLGTLLVALVLLVFGPWLVRRFYEFLKLISTMVIGLVAIAFTASLCFALAKEKALVFFLIEYLVLVAGILAVGNLVIFWTERQAARAARGASGRDGVEMRREPAIALSARRDEPAPESAAMPALRSPGALRMPGPDAADEAAPRRQVAELRPLRAPLPADDPALG